MNKILKLEPILKNYIWGGERLSQEFGYQSEEDRLVAEAWLLSGHPTSSNRIEGFNITLADYVNKHGKNFLGTASPLSNQMPILIKLIDAKEALSVQVHPDDKYAKKLGQPFGKSEMWYILDTDENNTIVYGTNKKITREELKKAIYEERVENILNNVPIKKGDSILIEAGTIHAINAGTLVFEVQQSSDTTFRLYDYNRVDRDGKKRELHIDESLKVSKLTPLESNFETTSKKVKDNKLVELQNHEFFNVELYNVEKSLDIQLSNESFASIIIIKGSGSITVSDESILFKKGESFVIPAQNEICSIVGRCEIIITKIG